MTTKTEIVAEIGSSHNGLKAWALEAVRLAKSAGADGVKFQYFGDPAELVRRRGLDESYVEKYREFNLPADWLPDLSALARSNGLRFICTAFRPSDVGTIAEHVDDFKVASFEAEAEDLLMAIASHRKPEQRVIVSLGRAASIETALRVVGRDVLALHCVSAYPTPVTELNLQRIAVEGLAGYSDHSTGLQEWIGALAVAAGARIVEAHLRLDATPPSNPDYPHSRSPYQFARYVDNIRYAERALGSGDRVAQPSEIALATSIAKRVAPVDVTARASASIATSESAAKPKR